MHLREVPEHPTDSQFGDLEVVTHEDGHLILEISVKNGVPATLGALTPDGPTIRSHNNLLGHGSLIDEVRVSSVTPSSITLC